MSVSQAQIADLLAKQEIHEAMLRYFRGIDRRDADLIGSAFHPDAVVEHGGKVWHGDTIGKTIASGGKTFTRTNHAAANHLIDLQGDTAYSETYMLCYLWGRDEQGENVILRMIRYIDQFEKRAGAWKIVRRKTVRDWERLDRVTERPPHAPYFDGVVGPEDISYRRARWPL